MQRNRYILCLLVCAFLLYYAVPRLHVFAQGAEGTFSLSWLIFALFVIAGNLTGILYHPNKKSGRNKKKAIGNYRGKTRYYQ
ncbi:MAG: hypothetical protein Q8929_07555 [Bacillota bacterium]|nr:hypothetical protein [Bacillota bacterium]